MKKRIGFWHEFGLALVLILAIALEGLGDIVSYVWHLPSRIAYRLSRPFRGINRLWAEANGYFWRPCPICGTWYGGHEGADAMLETGGAESYEMPLKLNGEQVASVPAVVVKGTGVCWKCGDAAVERNKARHRAAK